MSGASGAPDRSRARESRRKTTCFSCYSPRGRRAHHSTLREEHNGNCGVVLSVWDMIFVARKELLPASRGVGSRRKSRSTVQPGVPHGAAGPAAASRSETPGLTVAGLNSTDWRERLRLLAVQAIANPDSRIAGERACLDLARERSPQIIHNRRQPHVLIHIGGWRRRVVHSPPPGAG